MNCSHLIACLSDYHHMIEVSQCDLMNYSLATLDHLIRFSFLVVSILFVRELNLKVEI